MEYQSQDENGQVQWYTLVGNSVIPKKVTLNNFRLSSYMV